MTCKELDDIHHNMSSVLEKIVILASNSGFHNDCPVDKCYVDKIVHHLKQTMVSSLSYIQLIVTHL